MNYCSHHFNYAHQIKLELIFLSHFSPEIQLVTSLDREGEAKMEQLCKKKKEREERETGRLEKNIFF